MLGVLLGVDAGVEDTEILGDGLGAGVELGVELGVLVGVGVTEGQIPNCDIAPSVPTLNTSPDVLLNQLFPPLYKLAEIKLVLTYNAKPKEDA
jgi:hypothetical protein